MDLAGKYAGRGSETGQKKREEGKASRPEPPKARSERGKSASAASRTGIAPGQAKARPGKSAGKAQGKGRTKWSNALRKHCFFYKRHERPTTSKKGG